MKVEPVKTAIIGCGMIGEIYFKNLTTKFKIIDLVACCDLDKTKAEDFATRYNLKTMTLEEIIEDKNIELVVNLTNMPVHYSLNKQLLENGKHVYTEKMLATKMSEGAELVKIAKENNLYFGSAPDTFLGSAIQTAKYVVESGMIGEISSFYASIQRDMNLFLSPYGKYPEGTGIGYDVGIYYLTALLSILGSTTSVSGIMKTRNPNRKARPNIDETDVNINIECETIMSGTLEFKNGVIGNVLFDSDSVMVIPEKPALVLQGNQGILYMADPNNFGGEVKVLLKGNSEPLIIQQSHPYDEDSRGLGVAEMAWSIRKERPHRANCDMALHALEILEGISLSSKNKTHYEMKTDFEIPKTFDRSYGGRLAEFLPDLNESLLI